MRNNKILTAAVASAVSLGGGAALLSAGDVFAADLISHTQIPPVFATQLFPGNTDISTNSAVAIGTLGSVTCADTWAFQIRYKLTLPQALASGDILRITASLSGSAGWANKVDPLNQARFCTTSALTAGACLGDAPTDDALAVISKASAVNDVGLSSVQFAVQANGTVPQTSAYFYFCPDVDADFLQTTGSNLSLTLSTEGLSSFGGAQPLGTAETVTIASSLSGLSPVIDDGKSDPVLVPPLPAEAAISFAADSLKFATGTTKTNMVDIDRVSLGRVFIDVNGDTKGRDGSNLFAPTLSGWTASLTIIDGVFSASTGTANQVFLDDTGDCIYDTATVPPSIPADQVTSTVAEWAALDDPSVLSLNNGMHVCVIANGTTPIEEQPRAPTATLEMGPGPQSLQKYMGRLRFLKENGTKCTLFNIPDGTETLGATMSTDVVSVRVTNNGPVEGTLYATLYDQNGKAIYTPNKRQAIGTIGPFQTVRYYTGQENSDGYDPAFDLTTYGSAQHWVGQRATVVIATELPDVSAFGLIRNRNSGPNMNMSTGATGNGCD